MITMQENTLTVNGETILVPEISLLELETLKPELDLINEPGDSNAPKGGWDKARAMSKIICEVVKRDHPEWTVEDIRKSIPLSKIGKYFSLALGRAPDPKSDLPQVTPS